MVVFATKYARLSEARKQPIFEPLGDSYEYEFKAITDHVYHLFDDPFFVHPRNNSEQPDEHEK